MQRMPIPRQRQRPGPEDTEKGRPSLANRVKLRKLVRLVVSPTELPHSKVRIVMFEPMTTPIDGVTVEFVREFAA